MAVGNAIVTTAKFKPLSYNEWAAPLKEISTQHAALEDALYQLQEEASDYDKYIAENPDSDAARRYSTYIDELDRQAATLAANGINPQSRTDLMNLRRQYGASIKPIKQAVDTYRSLVDMAAKKEAQGYIVDKSNLTIPYLLENPDYVPSMINSKELEEGIGKLTAQTAKTMLPQATGQFYGDPRNKQEVYLKGISPDILDASLTNALSNNITNQYEAELRSYLDGVGFDNLPDDTKRQVLGRIRTAMESNSGFGYEIYDGLKYANIRSQMAHRGASGSGSGSGSGRKGNERKPKFVGTVSVRSREEKPQVVDNYVIEEDEDGNKKKVNRPVEKNVPESNAEITNKTDAEIPDNAFPISLEDAKLFMHDQFYTIFSKNAQKDRELEENADLYDFYVVPPSQGNTFDLNWSSNGEPSPLGMNQGTLYIQPKAETELQYNGEFLR